MENLTISINAVLPMFLLMMVGYGLTRIHLWDDHFLNVANRLCFKMALPILLFNNIYGIDMSLVTNVDLLIYAVVAVLIILVIMFATVLPFTKDKTKRGVLIQAGFRSNFVLFGLPVCQNLCGDAGAAAASMLIAIVVPFFNVIAAILLSIYSDSGKKVTAWSLIRSILTNPLIIATLLAFGMKLLPFGIPTPLNVTLNDIGKLGTPLALLTLGGQFHFDTMGSQMRYLIFGSVMRLVVIPILLTGAAIALGFRGADLGALLTMLGSPCAVSSFTMAKEMHADGELAGSLVVFTSLFSVLTMFLFVFTFKTLGLF